MSKNKLFVFAISIGNKNAFLQFRLTEERHILTITIKANVPAADAQGIKERIAMDIDRYGDCKVVSIVSDRGQEEQLRMKGDKV